MGYNVTGRTGSVLDVRADGAVPLYEANEPEAFSWTSVTVDPAANDTIIYVRNDSTSKHLHITDMYIYSDVPSAIDFFLPAYVVATGTAITGVCLNRANVTVAPATALGITTGDTLANIFATLYTNETTTDQWGQWLRTDGLLVLGYHDAVGIAIVAAATNSQAAVFGYFHDNH